MDIASFTFLAWPGVALTVILAGFWIFHGPIVRFIDRSNKVSLPGGGSIDAGPAKQIEAQTEPSKPAIPLPAPQPISGAPSLPPPPNQLIGRVEEDIRHQLATSFPDARDVQFAWAIRSAALSQVERDLEKVYRVIFGSQIFALKEINMRGGITVGDARKIYERAKEAFPALYADYAFEGWGGFVLEHGLAIVVNPTSSDTDRVVLTPFGKEFLFFLVARSLAENKPF